MKRTLILLTAIVGLMIVDVGSAQAWPGWRRRARATYYVPAQTATVAEGQATTGYRTYSYEPATASGNRSYRRSANIPPHMNAGGHSAGFKATDF